MSRNVVPAVIPMSQGELERVADMVGEFVNELHIDVVDGKFVPFVSWPYGEGEALGDPSAIEPITSCLSCEVDFMIENALDELPKWLAVGIKRAVIHIEVCPDIEKASKLVRAHGARIGISALNDTPIDMLIDALPYADYVQCMGIEKIGSQGQPFDERVFSRIDAIRKSYPDLELSIDGSVNQSTIGRIAEAGVHRFIVGSAIVKAPLPYVAYRALCA